MADSGGSRPQRSFNLMLVGSSGVGKTYLLKLLAGASRDNSGDADAEAYPDESEKAYAHSVQIDGEIVALTIFDTRGVIKKRSHCLWRCKDNSIDAFILVFSLDDPQSLKELQQTWIRMAQKHEKRRGKGCLFFVIGNSRSGRAGASRQTSTQVPKSEVDRFLREVNIDRSHFFETPTAVEQTCLKSTFHRVASDLLKSDLGTTGSRDEKVNFRPDSRRSPPADMPAESIWHGLGRTQLAVAACFGRMDMMQDIHGHSDTAVWVHLVNLPDHANMTPLMLAAANGHVNMLVQLHERGAKVNLKDRLEFTALTHAACRGHSEAVAKLLTMGAAAHVTDFCNNTPLIWAARAGFAPVIGQLAPALTRNQLQHAGEYGMSALQWANYFGHRDCQAALEGCIQHLLLDDSVDPASGAAATVHEHLMGQVPALEAAGPFYSMQRPMRGYAMIINNIDFPPNLDLARRNGADVDSQATGLQRAFVKMGLTPRLFQNGTSQFFEELMTKNCSAEKYADHDAFLLCISSHGGLGFIYASDGKQVLLEDVFDQVRRLPGLYGKPKIFVVQSCRDTLPGPPPLLSLPAPKRHEDCYYLYSVSEGGKAKRHPYAGCLFTNALRDVLMSVQVLPVPEFPQLIPQVVDRVAVETEGQQIVTSVSTLRRLIFFPPHSRWSCEESEEQ